MMRRQISTFIVIACVALVWPARCKAYETFFRDDFTNHDFASQWQVARSQQWQRPDLPCFFQGGLAQWKYVGDSLGIAIEGPGCTTEIIPQHFSFSGSTQYVYEFDWYLQESTHADRAVIFNWQNPLNWYDVKLLDNQLLVQKVVNGVGYDIPGNTGQYPFQADGTYHFVITVDGDKRIQVSVNNTPVLSATDQSPFLVGARTIGLQAATGSITRSLSYFSHLLVHGFETLGKILNVAALSQRDSSWSQNEYDHARSWSKSPTIEQWGCTLTSITMIMQYYQINKLPDGTPLTPASVNAWLQSQSDGFIASGLLNWSAITRLTRLISDTFGTVKLEYTATKPNLDLIKSEIRSDRPVILQVPGHFLVANGITDDGNSFVIHDPFFSYTRFDQPARTLLSARTFKPTHTDLSYLLFVHSPQTMLSIHDETGAQVVVDEIEEQIVNPLNPEEHTSDVVETMIAKPSDHTYTVTITTPAPARTELTLYSYDQIGNTAITPITTYTDKNGRSVDIQYHKTVPQPVLAPTTLDQFGHELKVLYTLGEIKKPLIYLKLNDLVQAGQRASLDQQGHYIAQIAATTAFYGTAFSHDAKVFLMQELNTLRPKV